MRIMSVVGARPNFMKLAPISRELARHPSVDHMVVHTGQHYDHTMSASFFEQLGIPEPEVNLGVGSGTHTQQTAVVMQRLEETLATNRPDIVLVYGDVNSTIAAALVAAKMGIPIGHVEAGLRSHDWTMPEEINRVVTDRLSNLLFTPSRDADENLRAEGINGDRIHFVGNIMIDTLVHVLPSARQRNVCANLRLRERDYAVVTLHRPSNVDSRDVLVKVLEALESVGDVLPVVFPIHPRTRRKLQEGGLTLSPDGGVSIIEPLGYLDMLGLIDSARLVVTDSGGLQEETTYLGIPCVTIRPNTERPITCTLGTNQLVDPETGSVLAAFEGALEQPDRREVSIEGWDGHVAERVVGTVLDRFL